MTHIFDRAAALCGAQSQALVVVGASCPRCTEMWLAKIKERGAKHGLSSDPQWVSAVACEEARLVRLRDEGRR